jgi:hypothetical protein
VGTRPEKSKTLREGRHKKKIRGQKPGDIKMEALRKSQKYGEILNFRTVKDKLPCYLNIKTQRYQLSLLASHVCHIFACIIYF